MGPEDFRLFIAIVALVVAVLGAAYALGSRR